jgi:hypothetical protein
VSQDENDIDTVQSKAPRHYATLKQQVAIKDILDTKLIRMTTDPEGVVRYVDGWSDERVASAVGGGINRKHVQTVRVELFGKLAEDARKPLNGADPLVVELAKRIDVLTNLFLAFATSFEEVTQESRLDGRRKVRAALGSLSRLTQGRD